MANLLEPDEYLISITLEQEFITFVDTFSVLSGYDGLNGFSAWKCSVEDLTVVGVVSGIDNLSKWNHREDVKVNLILPVLKA